MLLEAAEGEYNGKSYEGALVTYKRLLLLLERQDEATRLDQMPRALNGIGKSLERLGRPLEAAMAYREASTTWKGDPEFQKKNADGYYRAIGQVRKSAPSDDLIGEMYLAAENLAAEAASAEGGAGEIHWRRGERLYSQKDYAKAREEYLQVDPGEDVYEKAQTKASLCHYKLGDSAKATAEFEGYIRNYVPDPANTVTTKGKLDTRKQASAMATYYVGLIAKKNSEWDKVIEWLGNYDEAFSDQTDYAPAAMRLLMQAYNAKGELASVRDVLERMQSSFGNHPQTGAAAAEAAKTLAPLIDAAVKKGDETEADRLRVERAQFLNLGNSLDSKPNYGNLRNESVLWVELEEWDKAEVALRRLIDAFENDSDRADAMEKRILPDLGLVLLEQKRVPEALEILDPLIPDPDDKSDPRKPRSETVRSWCRAIGGWVEGDAETILEVPGAGQEGDFDKATKLWLKLTQQAANTDKWSCEWYELKFQTFYSYYRWGQLDSSKLTSTKEYLEDLRVSAQDPEFLLVSEKCGDELLRKRFLWLWEKVR